jgi:hypothetical protein
MTEKMHETTERRFACPTCHAERSEASTLGFLTAFGMTGKSVRDDRENARNDRKKVCVSYLSC